MQSKSTKALQPACLVEQTRQIETEVFRARPSFAVMRDAGREVAAHCRGYKGAVLLAVGPGNNGGDALIAGAELLRGRRKVAAWLPLGEPKSADAQKALTAYRKKGGRLVAAPDWSKTGLVVDGLFGIGLARRLDKAAAAAVEDINAAGLPVVAIDLPSGLCADSGQVKGVAVQAASTVTFFASKPGLLMGQGRQLAGKVVVADLGCAASVAGRGGQVIDRLVDGGLLRRGADAHKGTHGSLAVVGGARGMAGALVLATRAAVAHGAGKVFAVQAGSDRVPFDPGAPEVMWRDRTPAEATGLVVGVGGGTAATMAPRLQQALAARLPLVVDADGLNCLAARPALRRQLAATAAPVGLTPHPAEAARLLRTTTQRVQADRIASAVRLAERLQAVVVLKGAGTVVATASGGWGIVDSGNAGLAQAGSGDVLGGIIGALVVQGLPMHSACAAGAWLHGAAADALALGRGGELGMSLDELVATSSLMLTRLVG